MAKPQAAVVPKQGEIWIITVQNKQVPVLVVSKRDFISAEIIYDDGQESPWIIGFDWIRARLNKKSVIKYSKLKAINRSEFIRKVGRISQEDLDRILTKIKSVVF